MPDAITRPWDSPGLPPRTQDERCATHTHCAYRDDDPARCSNCHSIHCPDDEERRCSKPRRP